MYSYILHGKKRNHKNYLTGRLFLGFIQIWSNVNIYYMRCLILQSRLMTVKQKHYFFFKLSLTHSLFHRDTLHLLALRTAMWSYGAKSRWSLYWSFLIEKSSISTLNQWKSLSENTAYLASLDRNHQWRMEVI